ncbi:MAG: hypothetical protein U1A27_11600 [Phycisphaerae bacterium]
MSSAGMATEPRAGSGAAPRGRPISAGRRRAALLLALLLVLVGGVVGLEVIVRLFVPVTDVPFYFWDPTLGLRRAPNQAGRYLNGWDVRGRYHFNAQGWNDPREFSVARPAGVRRVCLVGDSQVESLQVQPDETMYAVAEQQMNRPDRAVQWYAFGCSGWGTQHEYECIRKYVLDYSPEVVVLLFVQNDPMDCSPYVGTPDPHSVVYWLDGQEQLTLAYPTEYEPSALRRLSARSALVRLLMVQHDVVGKLKARLSGKQVVQGVGQLPLRDLVERAKSDLVPGLATMSLEERQIKTWKLVEKLLEAARDECARRGARFVVASRGWSYEIDAPLKHTQFQAPPKNADPYCLDTRVSEMGREWVGPICARLNIPYLDLTAALQTEVMKQRQSHRFPKDNHYNALGHRAAGMALAAWIESLWAPGDGQTEGRTAR